MWLLVTKQSCFFCRLDSWVPDDGHALSRADVSGTRRASEEVDVEEALIVVCLPTPKHQSFFLFSLYLFGKSLLGTRVDL
jgi:hypothetical protein